MAKSTPSASHERAKLLTMGQTPPAPEPEEAAPAVEETPAEEPESGD